MLNRASGNLVRTVEAGIMGAERGHWGRFPGGGKSGPKMFLRARFWTRQESVDHESFYT